MLVQVIDAAGTPHFVAWQGQDQIVDRSGALDDAVNFQEVMPANVNRAGWLFQNTSGYAMLLTELDPVAPGAGSSWVVNSGGFFPPYPGYPIPTGAISVRGAAAGSQVGDTYAAREWINAQGE